MKKAEEYYNAFVTSGNIVSEFNIPAEHSMVRDLVLICSEIQLHNDSTLLTLNNIVGYG